MNVNKSNSFNANEFDNHNELKVITSTVKYYYCRFIAKTYEHATIPLESTQKTIELFKEKPFQFFLSRWWWGDNYVAVSLAGRIEPFYTSVSALEEMTGIKRSVLQSFNEKAIAQVINTYRYFYRARSPDNFRNFNSNSKAEDQADPFIQALIRNVNETKKVAPLELYNTFASLLKTNEFLFHEGCVFKLQGLQPFKNAIELLSQIDQLPDYKTFFSTLAFSLSDEHLTLQAFIGNEGDKLRKFLFRLPQSEQAKFMAWIDDIRDPSSVYLSKKVSLILKIEAAIAGNQVLPWSEIIEDPKLLGFLKEVLTSEEDRFILEKPEVTNWIYLLSTEQQQILVQQLKVNFSFTSAFLNQLIQWMETFDPDSHSQLQKMPQSGVVEVDNNLSKLIDVLNEKKIPFWVCKSILLSFLCQPKLSAANLEQFLNTISNNNACSWDLKELKGRIQLFMDACKSIQQEELLNIFCEFPLEKKPSFLEWLKSPDNPSRMVKICQAMQANQALPWKEILQDEKLIGFLEGRLTSKEDLFILENKQVQNLMSMLSAQQINLLVERLKQNLTSTSSFLTQLALWSQQSNERFQVQPSGNAELDQKWQGLVDFLDQGKIPSNIGVPILTAFFLQPDALKDLYPLLESLKAYKGKINADHLLYLIHAEPQVKAQLKRPRFLALLQEEKVDVNMLVGALKKVDEKLKNLSKGQPHYEKKKPREHYGFTIDEKGHYFIRTYPLGRGGFKKATKAVSDIEKNIVVLSFKSDPFSGTTPTKELEKEENILNRRLKKVMPPFISKQEAPKNPQRLWSIPKVVAVQKERSGDGERLIQGPPKQILYAITDVVEALIALHQSGYYHSDFKPGNFLFKGDPSDANKPIKGYLHDFGLVAKVGEAQVSGSPAYMPRDPRLPKQPTLGGEIDAYAVGVSLIELLMKVRSFDEYTAFYSARSQQELDTFIDDQFAKLDKSSFSDEEKQIMADLLELAKQLVKLEPKERLSCEATLAQLTELKKKYPFPSLPSAV